MKGKECHLCWKCSLAMSFIHCLPACYYTLRKDFSFVYLQSCIAMSFSVCLCHQIGIYRYYLSHVFEMANSLSLFLWRSTQVACV